jgi:5-bromo-4-chloroindolyl phosphate hydrolysis protein
MCICKYRISAVVKVETDINKNSICKLKAPQKQNLLTASKDIYICLKDRPNSLSKAFPFEQPLRSGELN